MLIMCLVLSITSAVAAPPTKYSLTSSTSSSSSSVPSSVSSVATLTNAANAANTAHNNLLQQTFFHQSPALNSRQRKRHSKRNSIRYGPSDLNENSTILEWVNPCGGHYDDTFVTTNQKPKWKILRKIYNDMKTAASQEFQSLNNSLKAIDINNIEIWSTHASVYKFLPKLKKNSTIGFKRWYRKMQTYVASFAYLRSRQLKWDLYHTQSEGKVAIELNILLRSSSSILCELETAMNKTHSNKKELPQVSRNQMNKRLKFQTREFANKNPKIIQEANPIDLIFVKYYYLEFLENIWKILRQFTKRCGQINLMDAKKVCYFNGKKKNNERKINNNDFNNINKQQKQKQRQNNNNNNNNRRRKV